MLVTDKTLVSFVKAKANIKDDEEEKEEEAQEKISVSDTWISLLSRAGKFAPPQFTKEGQFGNELMDVVLLKASQQIARQTGYTLQFVQHNLWLALKEDRHCNRNILSSIRFLRDFNSDNFILCPECEEENEDGWTKCIKCGFDKTKE